MTADLVSSSNTVAEHRFACASCDQEAGHIQLFGPADAGELIRSSFTSRLKLRINAAAFASVRALVLTGDVQALHQFNLEVASFYCAPCNASYCGDHWVRWDVFEDDDDFTWHDSIRGRCPRGHERMLED